MADFDVSLPQLLKCAGIASQNLANLVCDSFVNAGEPATKLLQTVLNDMGSRLAVDGALGPASLQVVAPPIRVKSAAVTEPPAAPMTGVWSAKSATWPSFSMAGCIASIPWRAKM